MGKSERSPSNTTLCAIFGGFFLVTTLALGATILFIVMNNKELKWTISSDPEPVNRNPPPAKPGGTVVPPDLSNPSVFDELTPSELSAVKKYLMNHSSLDIVPAETANLSNTHIFMMELLTPAKNDVLAYLNGGTKPARKALVVLIRGDLPTPQVEEYIVSPLPSPSEIRLHRSLPWRLRPRLGPADVKAMQSFLAEVTEPLYKLMKEKFGYGFHNCSHIPSQCLQWYFGMPPVPRGGLRNTWISFRMPYQKDSYHPIPLYLLIEDESNKMSEWVIEQVWYGAESYGNVSGVLQAYELGRLPVISQQEPIPLSAEEKNRVSMKPNYTAQRSQSGPETMETDGRRYDVTGHTVTYRNWHFDFRFKQSAGLQIFHVRFQEKQILYELSIQGILSYYSGQNPIMMHTRYLEDLDTLGFYSNELMPGVDCPYNADYFDGFYYSNINGRIMKKRRHICLFEHDTNFPLKRHFHGNPDTFESFAGIGRKVLVLRNIVSLDDIDFIFDFRFYENGELEVKYASSGIPIGSFWSPEYNIDQSYGYTVMTYQLAPIVQNLVHFKVDLDIHSIENTHEVVEVKLESKNNPYFPGEQIIQNKLERIIKETETDAVFKYDFRKPSFLLFYNNNTRNKFDNPRAYRLQLNDVSHNLLTQNWKWEKGISWARQQMAVTKHKDEEGRSTSFYNAMDPYNPTVDFSTFIDGEDIVNEDLVAWVTIGHFRLPSTSDVPLLSTVDTESGFKLLPFNFFDEDIMKTSPDYVFAERDGRTTRVVRKEGTTPKQCATRVNNPTFVGKDELV